jgi:hypothetical protein
LSVFATNEGLDAIALLVAVDSVGQEDAETAGNGQRTDVVGNVDGVGKVDAMGNVAGVGKVDAMGNVDDAEDGGNAKLISLLPFYDLS